MIEKESTKIEITGNKLIVKYLSEILKPQYLRSLEGLEHRSQMGHVECWSSPSTPYPKLHFISIHRHRPSPHVRGTMMRTRDGEER